MPRVEGVARDEGDVILSWLTRIVVGIAVTAVIGFDSLSIAVTHVSTSLWADPDGTIHLRLTHVAMTMVVQHLGPLRSWGEVTATGTGRVTTP